MFKEFNPNPVGRTDAGDCAIRAVAKALNISWEDAYVKLCVSGFAMGDLPNADNTFGAVLRMHGFKKRVLPDTCPDCYRVEDFAKDNPHGIFVLGLGGHVVTIVNGDIYDAWDSSNGIPIYFWFKDERVNNESIQQSNTVSNILGASGSAAVSTDSVSKSTIK